MSRNRLRSWRRALGAACVSAASLAAAPVMASAAAQQPAAGTATDAPSVSLALPEASVGTEVTVSLRNFTSKVLTIQVCGNEGRRGSVDCNVADATTIDMPSGKAFLSVPFTMVRPPAPCPCLVQVSSERFDEVAVAGFTLLGHPMGDVVDAGKDVTPLQVSVVSHRVDDGSVSTLRSSLGGHTQYDVTVIVKNASSSTVRGAVLSVVAGRGEQDEILQVPFRELGELAAQQTWRQTVRVELPSPVYGSVTWRATTTAFALSSTATTRTSNRPTLLFVFSGVFGLCVLTLLGRLAFRLARTVRRRNRGRSSVPTLAAQ